MIKRKKKRSFVNEGYSVTGHDRKTLMTWGAEYE